VSAMALGARGSYSSMISTDPNFCLKMFALAEAHRWDEAFAQQGIVARFFRELGALLAELKLGGIDPVGDKGLAVASGLLAGHQRTRPPYIGWSDAGVKAVRQFLIEQYPMFLAEESASHGVTRATS
jgi:dihydrodipicolinate synthase/N-acetylneuraminate lyase